MPCSRNEMSHEERRKALRYLMFLKEMQAGTIKARGCVYVRPQRGYKNAEDTSSPNVSIEALRLLCDIDSKENRYLVVSDIPGSFLCAEVDDNVHML